MTEEQQVPTLGACYSKVYVLQRKIRNGLNRTFTVPYFSQDCPDQVLTNNRHHLGKKKYVKGTGIEVVVYWAEMIQWTFTLFFGESSYLKLDMKMSIFLDFLSKMVGC